MDELPYENLEELIRIFHEIFTVTDFEKNEEILVKMMQKPLKFVESLTKIMMNEKSDEESIRSKREVIPIFSLLSRKINLPIPEKELEKIVNLLIKCLLLQIPDLDITSPLQRLIQFFCSLNEKILKKICSEAGKKMVSQNIEDIFSSVLLLECLVPSLSPNEESIIEKLYPNFLTSGGALVSSILGEAPKIQEGVAEEITKKFARIVINILRIDVLSRWTFILNEFIGKNLAFDASEKNASKRSQKKLKAKQEAPNILISILELQLPNLLNPLYQGLVPILTKDPKLSEMLNKAKTFALECCSAFVDNAENENNSFDANENIFFSLIKGQGTSILLRSLYALSELKFSVLEEYLQNDNFGSCLSKSLKVVSQLVDLNKLDNTFLEARSALIMDICIPLVLSTKKDMELLHHNPHKYLALIPEDEIHRDDVKSRALTLISVLCDCVDGSLSFAVTNMLAVINYSLLSNELDQIPARYPILLNYRESIILTQIPPNRRVETCLFVLKCLAASICDRPDLIEMVENVFISFKDFFSGEQCDNLIRARICQAMEDYLQILFCNNQQAFEDYLMLLVEFAGIEAGAESYDKPEEFVVSTLAIRAVEEILLVHNMFEKIVPYINQIFGRIVAYVEYHKNPTFFEILPEIIETYKDNIRQDPDLFLRFIESITLRIQTELTAVLSGQSSKLLITKIWGILITIIKYKELLPFQNEIDKHLIPVFMAVLEADLSFEEDILDYMNNILKVKKEVSPLGLELFKKMPKIFAKLSNDLPAIFPTLYQIIAYEKDIANYPECIDWLIEIATETITSGNDSVSVCLSALLLQIVIQYVQIKEDKQLERILKTCCDALQGCSKDFEKAKLVGTLLLALQQDFERTQSCLAKHGVLENIMKLIIAQPIVFNSHNYDRKLLVTTLTSFFVQESIEGAIKDKFPRILQIIVCFLTIIQKLENMDALEKINIEIEEHSGEGKKKKELVKEILGEFILNQENINEDNNEEEDEQNIFSEEEQVNQYLSSWVIGSNEKDEFRIFRETILELKSKAKDFFKRISESLSETHKEYRRDILKTQKVVVNEEKQEVKTRRVLKVMRRKDKKETE